MHRVLLMTNVVLMPCPCFLFLELFKGGSAALYGFATAMPDRSLVGDIAKSYIDVMFKA